MEKFRWLNPDVEYNVLLDKWHEEAAFFVPSNNGHNKWSCFKKRTYLYMAIRLNVIVESWLKEILSLSWQMAKIISFGCIRLRTFQVISGKMASSLLMPRNNNWHLPLLTSSFGCYMLHDTRWLCHYLLILTHKHTDSWVYTTILKSLLKSILMRISLRRHCIC